MASAPRHAILPNRSRRNVLAALGVVLLLAAGTAVLWLTLRGYGGSDRATADGGQAGTSTAASTSGTVTVSTPDAVPSSTALPESVASTSAVVPPASTSSAPMSVAPPPPSVPSEQPDTPSPESQLPAAPPVAPDPAETPGTTPANPDPADPPTPAPASPESLAAAIVSYYDQMPSDTDRAWALLTDNYRTEIARNRQSFQRFWDRVDSVAISDATGTAPGTVEATLTYTLTDGRVSIERTRYHLVRDDGVLKIDSSTVLSARSG